MPAGAPRGGDGSAPDLDQVFAPRGGDESPRGSVPLSPTIASYSRFHDVPHRERVHVPAAVAVEGAGADPVATGDGAEREPLQQRSVDRGLIRVCTGCTAAHQADDGLTWSDCSTRRRAWPSTARGTADLTDEGRRHDPAGGEFDTDSVHLLKH